MSDTVVERVRAVEASTGMDPGVYVLAHLDATARRDPALRQALDEALDAAEDYFGKVAAVARGRAS